MWGEGIKGAVSQVGVCCCCCCCCLCSHAGVLCGFCSRGGELHGGRAVLC